jgi:flotillin
VEIIGKFFVPVMAIFIVVALLAFARIMSNNYIKVPPNKAAIFYGREYVGAGGQKVGFKVVTGSSRFKRPIIESVQYLNLATFSIPLEVENVPNKDGVLVNVKGVALVKILSEEVSLMSAVERFLGKTEQDIEHTAHQNLEGHLRSIVGQLTVEELVSDRSTFNQKVLSEATDDLRKIGLGIDMLTIQHVEDKQNYITSLGKKRTAEVQRDAQIGEAEAQSKARIAASNALKEAEMVAAQNDVLIADAKKKRDVQVAQFKAQTEREQATADQAGAIAAAEADLTVRQRRVQAEAAETTARIQLADQETLRVEKELQFKVIKPAQAKRDASVIEAEGAKQTGILQAETEKQTRIIQAEAAYEAAAKQADATRTSAQADGDAATSRGKGDAEATRARLTAEADGEKAKRLAAAAGTEAELKASASGKEAGLLAEAKGTEAKLLAEAKGKAELAKALALLDSTGKLLQVLEAAPRVAEALGEALAKALGPEGLANVFGQMAAPLGNVDSIRMYDFGGNGSNGNGNGAGSLAKFANTTPEIFFNAIAKAKALGFGDLLAKFGLTSDILEGLTGIPSIEDGTPKA